MINPWQLLQVTAGDPVETLKTNYRSAIRKAHPDLGGNKELASDINRAYDFLSRHLIDDKVPPVTILPSNRIRQEPVAPQWQPTRQWFTNMPFVQTSSTTTSTAANFRFGSFVFVIHRS